MPRTHGWLLRLDRNGQIGPEIGSHGIAGLGRIASGFGDPANLEIDGVGIAVRGYADLCAVTSRIATQIIIVSAFRGWAHGIP